MPVEVGILGPVETVRDGRPVLLGARQRALLAAFAMRAGQVVAVSRLVDDMWADEPPESAVNVLQGYVSDLRKALGRDAIRTHGRGYVLEVPPEALDARRFESLLARSEREPPPVAAETLRQALALWRGPPLADIDAPFAAVVAARLDELRLLALERRLEADLELGRHRQLVGELEALIAEEPLRESLCALLMLALYRSDRQADALAAYRRIRGMLVEELGLEPGAALQLLHGAILRQDGSLLPAPTLPAPRRLLVGLGQPAAAEALLAIAARLTGQPRKELIVVGAVDDPRALRALAASLRARRDRLAAEGVVARAAPVATVSPGKTFVALAAQQDAELLLIAGTAATLSDEPVRTILAHAGCDVAVVVARPLGDGPVLVPFVGGDHDWAAIEIGAWAARARDVPLVLAGPLERGKDASLLLANASLAVQRALGIVAEPMLVDPAPHALVQAAEPTGLVVVGLPDRWRSEGLGHVRHTLAAEALPPVLLVRKGVRPGGLAPRESLTRFTWSLGSG